MATKVPFVPFVTAPLMGRNPRENTLLSLLYLLRPSG